MSYLGKFVSKVGNIGRNKGKRIDEATSNSSLSNLRYVITEKPKWKVFRKKEIVPLPAYCKSGKGRGCPCGSSGPCKQKVTPNGVTIHYPQNKRKPFTTFSTKKKAPGRTGFFNSPNPKTANKAKPGKPKKFLAFRLDKIHVKPIYGPKIITPTAYQGSI